MKKKIVFLGSLFLGVMYLCGMEECPVSTDKEFVTIKTSDKKEFKLSTKLAQKSETISSMQVYQPNKPVVLRLISSQLFQLIKNVLESPNPQQVIMKQTLSQFVEFIQAVNFLIIPDLIDISIQELAERNLSQNDLNMLFEELDPELIKKLWSVHNFRFWLLKKWWKNSKRIDSGRVVLSPNGRYLVLWPGYGGTIKILNVDNDFVQVGDDLKHASVSEVLFSPSGRYLVSKSDKENTIKIWDADNDFEQVGNILQDEFVFKVIFSPDEKYLISPGGSSITIWDVNNDFEQVSNLLQQVEASYVTFSPNGKYLVTIFNGILKVWNVDNNFIQVGDDLEHLSVSEALFSPNGKYLFSKSWNERTIKIWDVNNDFTQFGTTLSYFDVENIKFSSDGRYLALPYYESDKIAVFDLDNHFNLVRDYLQHDFVESLVFSPSGRYLVSSGVSEYEFGYKGTIKIWDVDTNFEQVGDALTHEGVKTVVFSPDERYLVSFSRKEETIKIWNIKKDFEFVFLKDFVIKRVIFTPDGRYLILPSVYSGNTKILNMNILQQIISPTFDEIKLFLSAYFNVERGESVQNIDELRNAFDSLSPDLQSLLPEQFKKTLKQGK